MLREKRIVKQPISFQQLYQEPKRKTNSNAKKQRKLKRCEFKTIPGPVKFISAFKPYPLLGGIVLVEKDGIISSEASAIAKSLNFRKIEVTQNSATKLVQIDVEHQGTSMAMPWDQVCQEFESSMSLESDNWAFLIRNFGSKYDKFFKDLQERNYKLAKDEQEEEDFAQVTKNTENKKSQLLEFLPCVHYKLRFNGSDVRMNQITFNNLFLREVGYSIDSFVTTVFQEGLPQFISYDSEANQYATKALLQNYFNLGRDGFTTPELNLSLFMKSSYVKNAKAQIHFFMNYEGGNFGIDIITSIIAREEPHLDYQLLPKAVVNKAFIREKAEYEHDLADFLNVYYKTSFTLRYAHFGKVCTIKELPARKGNM